MEGSDEPEPVVCMFEENCREDYRSCLFRKKYICPRDPENREIIERFDISDYIDRSGD